MSPPAEQPVPRAGLAAVCLAAVAVLFAAADTYVVVLALPEVMVGVGLDIDDLQRAVPIVSVFLLGYVAVLPLIGRLSDLVGRLPVLVGSLLVFAAGSLLTATAADLGVAVAGRFLQGVGGGGLVPATLALVADVWPVQRRGLPLGMVGAAQELGSVVGPLYGAMVLALASWRAIFWLNLVAALALAAGLSGVRRQAVAAPWPGATPSGAPGTWTGSARSTGRPDLVGATLGVLAVAGGVAALVRPRGLVESVTWGGWWVPTIGSSAWTSPVALASLALAAGFLARQATASRPLVNVRGLPALLRASDVPGAALLGAGLGGIVLAFATADPSVELMSPRAPWMLAGSALAFAGFAVRQRYAHAPLVPVDAVRQRGAWGSLAVSLLVGAALIAVLVDVPVFARTVLDDETQLDAALVLLRFLAALPVGALLGGWLVRHVPPGPVAAAGMAIAAAGLLVMARWGADALEGRQDDAVLVVTGLGFGLAVAPVNAALLAATPRATHGVASALLVVARMVGMLAGLSALTAIGLRRLYSFQRGIESPAVTCPETPTDCPPYAEALREAILAQLNATFAGAAVCAAGAAALSLLLLRGAGTRAGGTNAARGGGRP